MDYAEKIKLTLAELSAQIHLKVSRSRRNANIARMTRTEIARFFTVIRSQFAPAAAKLTGVAAQPAPGDYEQPTYIKGSTVLRGQAFERARAPGYFLISICFGLLAVCGIMLAVLYTEMKDLKSEIGLLQQSHAAMQARLGQLEKAVQQKIVAKEAKIVEAPSRHAIALSGDDMKLIRSFIKVVPSRGGDQPKIHPGDEILDGRAVPVPELLISQVPKLRGARFLIDPNGAIIILGEGGNRADAVIEPE